MGIVDAITHFGQSVCQGYGGCSSSLLNAGELARAQKYINEGYTFGFLTGNPDLGEGGFVSIGDPNITQSDYNSNFKNQYGGGMLGFRASDGSSFVTIGGSQGIITPDGGFEGTGDAATSSFGADGF